MYFLSLNGVAQRFYLTVRQAEPGVNPGRQTTALGICRLWPPAGARMDP
jgi:hypothetical protein